MKRMVTTTEAIKLLSERGLDVPYQTVVRWARSGKFAGAQLEDTPRGPVWLIPADAVTRFQLPKRGRIPNINKKPAKRARKGA